VDRIKGVGRRSPVGRLIISGTANFNIGSLSDDPNFDFINLINSNLNNDSDDSSLRFLDSAEDSPYNPNSFSCSYVDANSLCNFYSKSKNVSIMSLNVQSLQAKFLELQDLLNHTSSLGFLPDIILLQEIWQVPDASLFILNSYQPLFFKCRERGQGGGWAFI
jgi:hypothetical protein